MMVYNVSLWKNNLNLRFLQKIEAYFHDFLSISQEDPPRKNRCFKATNTPSPEIREIRIRGTHGIHGIPGAGVGAGWHPAELRIGRLAMVDDLSGCFMLIFSYDS